MSASQEGEQAVPQPGAAGLDAATAAPAEWPLVLRSADDGPAAAGAPVEQTAPAAENDSPALQSGPHDADEADGAEAGEEAAVAELMAGLCGVEVSAQLTPKALFARLADKEGEGGASDGEGEGKEEEEGEGEEEGQSDDESEVLLGDERDTASPVSSAGGAAAAADGAPGASAQAAFEAARARAAGGAPVTAERTSLAARLSKDLTDKSRLKPWDHAAADQVFLPAVLRALTQRRERGGGPFPLSELKLRLMADLGYTRTINTKNLLAYLHARKEHVRVQSAARLGPNAPKGAKPCALVWAAAHWAEHAAQTGHAHAQPAARPPPPLPRPPGKGPAPGGAGVGGVAGSALGSGLMLGSALQLAHALLLALARTHGRALSEPELERALPPLSPALARRAAESGSLFDLCAATAAGRVAPLPAAGGAPRRLQLRAVSAPMPASSRAVAVQTEDELVQAVALVALNAPAPGLLLPAVWERAPPVPPALRELLGLHVPRGLTLWVRRHPDFFRMVTVPPHGNVIMPARDDLPPPPPKGGPAGAKHAPPPSAAAAAAGRTSGAARYAPPAPPSGQPPIRQLAEELGLGRYAAVLEQNDVDLPTLRLLTQEDFREMGITSIGAQRKLQAAAAALGDEEEEEEEPLPYAPALPYAPRASAGAAQPRGHRAAQAPAVHGVRQPNGVILRQPTPKDFMAARR